MLKVHTETSDVETRNAAAQQHNNAIQRNRFSPYVNNGGTVLAVAGADFCVVAGDTRFSLGYSIQTRNGSKLLQLGNNMVLGTSGMQADMQTLFKVLRTRAAQYQHDHNRPIPTQSMAQLLSTTLYYKRFFPYYTFNLLGGLDENGAGCVYSYDAVGSFERYNYHTTGSGAALVMPLLDNQVGHHNLTAKAIPGPMTVEQAIALVLTAMSSAGERDIHTGDSVEVAVITKEGIQRSTHPLSKD